MSIQEEARVQTIKEVSEIFISEMEESCDAVRPSMICQIARRLDYDPEKLLEMALNIRIDRLNKHYRSKNKHALRIHNENQKPGD